jgi:hypothetical protein
MTHVGSSRVKELSSNNMNYCKGQGENIICFLGIILPAKQNCNCNRIPLFVSPCSYPLDHFPNLHRFYRKDRLHTDTQTHTDKQFCYLFFLSLMAMLSDTDTLYMDKQFFFFPFFPSWYTHTHIIHRQTIFFSFLSLMAMLTRSYIRKSEYLNV